MLQRSPVIAVIQWNVSKKEDNTMSCRILLTWGLLLELDLLYVQTWLWLHVIDMLKSTTLRILIT